MIAYGVIVVLALLCLWQAVALYTVRRQLKQAGDVLSEIQAGNLQRRLLARRGDLAAGLCQQMNQIVIGLRDELETMRQSEQGYRQLVTSLSHDVRTPLASLSGYLEAAATGLVEGAEREQYLDTAQLKARELTGYVDTLFLWLKLESGEHTLHPSREELGELLRIGVSGWVERWERLGFAYDVDIAQGEIWSQVDREAFLRILDNLVQNALTHSGGDWIGVSLTMEENLARLTVSDNGRGIPDAQLPHLFDRLYKGDAARGGGGSGLGLSIVQELARGHGGSVQVHSTGRGSVFTVLLRMEETS